MTTRVLMGLWFILYGVAHFVPAPPMGVVLAVGALVLGILIIAGQ